MVRIFTRFTSVIFCCFLLVVLFYQDAAGQVSINPFTKSYTQDFNALPISGQGTWVSGTAYFPGWYLNRTVTATTTLLTGTGSSNAGGVYSYGAAGNTDRALGAISSATATVGEFAWGLLVQNNSGATITALNISFTGEQWRSASTTAPQQTTTFWYATNANASAFDLNPKSDAGWTSVRELDFSGPVFKAAAGGLDGNSPANRRLLSAVIPVTIPNGHYVMLRWKDLNDLYDDHGLAIDDFSMTWNIESTSGPTPLPVELVSFKATTEHQHIKLNWTTASEKDNKHFIVERSQTGKSFTSIATIVGKGNSATRSSYTFTDDDPIAGVSYYRLKQVDFDGTNTYSKAIAVKWQAVANSILYPTITSDVLYLDVAEKGHTLSILDLTGKPVYQQELSGQTRSHTLHVSNLKAGNYHVLLLSEKGERQVLRFLKR